MTNSLATSGCTCAPNKLVDQSDREAVARRADRRLESAQHAEEIADVRDDGLRFFPGRNVSASGVIPLLLEVVVALGPAARGAEISSGNTEMPTGASTTGMRSCTGVQGLCAAS